MVLKVRERQRAVLRMIVSEYVATAVPVGSDTVVKKYGPGVSPATVRHDMGALASAGYIFRPHPSAGRVPSSEGYRFFVRNLMGPTELSSDERCMVRHLFHQVERDLDQWMQLSATILAQLTGNASVVTLPVTGQSRLRHLDLVATQDRATLLVVLFQEGSLHRHLMVHALPVKQSQLDDISLRLNQEFHGRFAREIEQWKGARSPVEQAVRDALVDLMRRVDQRVVPVVWYDGVSSLLAEPEFARSDMAREIVRAFEQRQFPTDIVRSVADAQSTVRVMIGDEVPWPVFRSCALVAMRYGSEHSSGALGVIGPTRMRYDRVIATVEYVAELMTNLWAELCE